VVAGTRFLILTYIRLDSVVLVDAPTLNQLFVWGYPAESLALLHDPPRRPRTAQVYLLLVSLGLGITQLFGASCIGRPNPCNVR